MRSLGKIIVQVICHRFPVFVWDHDVSVLDFNVFKLVVCFRRHLRCYLVGMLTGFTLGRVRGRFSFVFVDVLRSSVEFVCRLVFVFFW